MFTAHFERFVRPARAYPQVWRLVAGIVVIAVIYFLGLAVLFTLIGAVSGITGIQEWAVKVAEASTPTSALLMLSSYIGLAVAVFIAARAFQHRSAGTLFGPMKGLVKDFAITAGVVAVLYGVLQISWSSTFGATPNTELLLWLTFMPLALLAILVQTGAEELVLRGYLQQQLAARFRSPYIWMVFPSIVFGLLHLKLNAAGTNVWLPVVSATVFGLVAADLTRITGSIGASWGFHFVNNVLAVLIVAVEGTIPGLALYLTPSTVGDSSQFPAVLAFRIAALLVAWIILRRVLRR